MTSPIRVSGTIRDLGGGFLVRRLLPSRALRAVGPFVFFDHFGPVTVNPHDDFDVRPHPHIGLATVTYLFEGAMMHRDSLGFVQRIEPGAINWMNAGRGIVHSERRPADLADRAYVSHGLQLWVALPRDAEESEPTFAHTPATALPDFALPGVRVRVLVGTAWGRTSPVATRSPLVYVALELGAGAELDVPALAPELAAYAIDAPLELNSEPIAAQTLAPIAGNARRLRAPGAAARVVLIGGELLDSPRDLWWNFVSSRPERIEQAADEWASGRMPAIPGESAGIPLPARLRPGP